MRSFVFALEGVTTYMPTPPSLLEVVGKEYKLYRETRFVVRLPIAEQDVEPMFRYKDPFVQRVIETLPQLSVRLGGPACGKAGDFVAELQTNGQAGAGHFIEHCQVVVFDEVALPLGFREHELVWRTKVIEQEERYRRWTRYRTRQYHAIDEIPPELFGWEGIVFGWLRAEYESAERAEAFGLRDRIDDFIQYRREPPRRSRSIRRTPRSRISPAVKVAVP